MPDWKDEIRKRLATLNLSATREAEIAEELSQHLEDRYQELRSQGRTEEESRAAVLVELDSNKLFARELQKTQRRTTTEPIVFETGDRGNMIEHVWQDLRFAIRMLSKHRSFTAIAVLTLALGIGATTAIFSVFYATLLEPLPYPKPDQLMMVWSQVKGARNSVTVGDYLDWKARGTSFQSLSAWTGRTFNIATLDRPEQINGAVITPDFFRMTGIPMFMGRSFLQEEAQPGNEHVVIISNRIWSQHFGADPQIIGKQIRMNNESYTVVGVLRPGMHDRAPSQIWVPLSFQPDQINHQSHRLRVMGRLKDGVSMARAQAEMNAIGAQIAQEHPETNTNSTISVEPLHNNFLAPDTVQNLWLLMSAVGFLLLIACVNIANMLLARGTARQREIALRAALGASRTRIFSQLLTESVVLAAAGGILGIFLAVFMLKSIISILPPILPSEADFRISIPVLIFTTAASMFSGLLFGCVPAFEAAKLDLNETLKQGGRSGPGRHGIRRALIVTEFALALTLLAGGGLALRSFWNLTSLDLGIVPDNVLTFNLPVAEGRLTESGQMSAYYRQILEKIQTVPGVRNAAVTTGIPILGTGIGVNFSIVGQPEAPGARRSGSAFQIITPGYFETFGVRVVKGRAFTDSDTTTTARVAIVNEAFANRYLSGMDPLSQVLAIDELIPGSSQKGKPQQWQVVGVFHRVFHNVRNEDGPRSDFPEIYVPFWQSPWPRASVAVRTNSDPNQLARSIATAVNSVDPDLPLAGIKTMNQLIDESLRVDRFGMLLYGSFAVLALILAAAGIYGVMAFAVAQRTQEFGVRLALGAQGSQVLGLILKEGMMLALLGSLLGLGGAYAIGRLMQSSLYNVAAIDVTAMTAVILILFFAALLACYFPGRRAAKVDPMVALRCD